MLKQFAFFLPQFHTIPENDRWWGRGFTEWTNVKNALPLYKGHVQPKLPQNNYFYNLLDKRTMEWQTELMHKYHVDGMIYYHYYFRGKLLLEKPAENLLMWKDIKQPFFFCWANHSWCRSWEGTQELLVGIEYGEEKDWEKHFQYLLPFFKDSRYEKRNNKPVFMLFQSEFPEKNNIFTYFDKRCKENGFDGICVIETIMKNYNNNTVDDFWQNVSKQTEFVFLREPAYSRSLYFAAIKYKFERIKRALGWRFRNLINRRRPIIFDGNKLYEQMISNVNVDPRVIRGSFFEWDNTPRHKTRGYVITPVTKELYFSYMDKLINDEYVFINAWNEWGEGMILEPTDRDGYKYLEWISEWVTRNVNEFDKKTL